MKIPQCFHDIINRLEVHHMPSSTIAGGCIRDLYLDRPYRDIDLYVFDRELKVEYVLGQCEHLDLHLLGDQDQTPILKKIFNTEDVSLRRQSTDYPSYGTSSITQVYDIKFDDQIIEMMVLNINPVDYVVNNFDVELSKAYFNRTGLTLTTGFITDVENKTITLSQSISPESLQYATNYHIPKIQKYFPDFTVVGLPC